LVIYRKWIFQGLNLFAQRRYRANWPFGDGQHRHLSAKPFQNGNYGRKEKMIHKMVGAFLTFVLMSAVCSANSLELDLTAGSTSVSGGVHYKNYVESGYFRVGGSVVHTDDDEVEYTIGSLDLTVGSDTLMPGLSCDVGLRGIYGTAEDGNVSGDVGALGFTGGVGYLFPSDMIPIPVEVFGGLTWAPGPLAFIDTEDYLEFNAGVGVRIIRNASIVASYTHYRIEMESGPGDWTLKDDVFRLGLAMRF